MSPGIALPQTNSRSKTTKDLVISVLSENWPLSAKEVFNQVNKEGKNAVSYQAVHKLLLQLCEERVLEKKNNKYQLSKAWIADSKRFISSLEKKYESKEAFLSELSSFHGSFEFEFNNVTDFSLSMAEMFLHERCIKAKGRFRIGVLRHGWWPLTFSFDQFLLLRKIGKVQQKPYNIIRKETPFGKWVNQQYNQAGFNSKIIPGFKNEDDDVVIMGSLIVQVNYSKQTKNAIDRLYEKTSGLTALFKEYVVQTFPKKNTEIRFKMTENPALAATLGKHYVGVWKQN